ncbi:hypothetical protein HCN56_05870 [Streptomyces lonarensis]|uniref:Polyketide synthase NorB/C/GfsB-E-like docking domain-containing protein n=2 Tax=Streptomyces lonarensis TaxID=700599 RepID=A0A7X6CYW8_9ACTN|nr:hypothetical protein [Streptomyces lonarensis]
MDNEQKLRDYLKRATADLRRSRRRVGELEAAALGSLLPALSSWRDRARADARASDLCYRVTWCHVSPEQLEAGTRPACLSDFGLNLLLQRRVHHFSRVVVPTFEFQPANEGVLRDPQQRSTVRRRMRQHLRKLRGEAGR